MRPEDRIRIKSNDFDQAAWIELWDRIPERMRPHLVEFVLQYLHATESGGLWKLSWHDDSNEKREQSESDDLAFEFDQPGDLITFKGYLRVGDENAIGAGSDPVGVACLTIFEWISFREARPTVSAFGDDYREWTKQEDQRFAKLALDGKNPCRVNVSAAEFVEWCSRNNRSLDPDSLETFGAEKFRLELHDWRNRHC